MDDLISRQETVRKWCLMTCGFGPYECRLTYDSDGTEDCSLVRFLMDKENLPSAQPDIVRCKDCKWFCHIVERISSGTPNERTYDFWECEFERSTDGNWFCADGERKSDG